MKFKDKIVNRIGETAAKAAVGFKSGESNNTKMKMNTSSESLGIIASVLTVNKTVYAICYRQTPVTKALKEHPEGGVKEYYNCTGDVFKMSPYELLMPIKNLDLSRDIIDPRTLIGQKVLVSEINGQALKAEYINELDELNESPLKISRALLRTIRNYVGGYTTLDSKEERVQKIMAQFGLTDVAEKLHEHPLSDWLGQSVSFKDEGKYTNDVAKPKDGEVVFEAPEGVARHLNRTSMKTKNCHLPVKLFSAR